MTDRKGVYQKNKDVDRSSGGSMFVETAKEPGGFFKPSGLCQDVYQASQPCDGRRCTEVRQD